MASLEKCGLCGAWRARGIEMLSHMGAHSIYDGRYVAIAQPLSPIAMASEPGTLQECKDRESQE